MKQKNMDYYCGILSKVSMIEHVSRKYEAECHCFLERVRLLKSIAGMPLLANDSKKHLIAELKYTGLSGYSLYYSIRNYTALKEKQVGELRKYRQLYQKNLALEAEISKLT